MTSQTETLSTYVAAPKASWRRPVFAFALTLSAIVLFGAAFAVGYGRMNDGRVLPGVDVAGVDLAGLSRTAAAAKLRQVLPSLSEGELNVNLAGSTATIPYSDFDRDYDIEFMLDQAFGLGRGDNFIDQLRAQMAIAVNGISVQPQVTWNNEELALRVAALANAAQVTPVDAAITREDGHYVVTPAADGVVIDTQAAVGAAMAAINNLSAANTAIKIDGTHITPTVTTEAAQVAADRAERVGAAGLVLSGEELNTTIGPDVIRGWVYLNEIALGDWQTSISPDAISQWLAAYAYQTDVAPTNATFTFEGGNVSVVPSAQGRALDVQASTSNVMAALQARADGDASPTAQLALTATEPEFDTAQAQSLASRVTMLGTWTTHYTPQLSNGNGVNIQIPTSTIDGYVVQPGEKFDFLTAIGPITSPPYQEGGVLIHGQIKEDGAIGGGMCSCSTTLFNAAMRAGLQIDARGNHSIYISRYPVGLDATVWMSGGSRRTMAFTNDTGYPVLIKGINERGKVIFELYGIDDGRTVELQEPRVENIVKAGLWLEYSDKLAPGERRKEQDAYDSFDSWVTRIVRDAQGNIIHEDTWVSHYKKLDAITLVGRFPGDPVAGTRVRPEDYHGGTTPPPPPPPPDNGGTLAANFTKAAVDADTYAFTDASTGDITTWSWNFGDGGTSDRRNPNHDFSPGTYTVTLTVTDSTGATSSRSKSVTVSDSTPPPPAAPSAKFSVSGSGVTYTFTATGANADQWTWTYSDGGQDSGPSATHTFVQNETDTQYTVTLTVSGPGGEASKTKTVTVPGSVPPV